EGKPDTDTSPPTSSHHIPAPRERKKKSEKSCLKGSCKELLLFCGRPHKWSKSRSDYDRTDPVQGVSFNEGKVVLIPVSSKDNIIAVANAIASRLFYILFENSISTPY